MCSPFQTSSRAASMSGPQCSGVTKTTSPCCSYTVRASLVSGCVCWLAAMMVCLLPTTIAREPQYGWDQQYGEYV